MLHPHRIVNILSFILIAIFLTITVIVVQYTVLTKQHAEEKNLMTFTASAPAGVKEKELTIDINVKKPETAINGVYFSVAFPESKMSLIDVDTWNTAFDTEGEDILSNGYLKYGRDSSKPLIGDQHVATLRFNVKEPVELSELSVIGDASIVTPDLKNIISQRPSITYVEHEKSKTDSFFDLLNQIIYDFPHFVLNH